LLFAPPARRLCSAAERLPRALKANAQIHLTQYSRSAARLTPLILRARIVRERERTDATVARTRRAASVLSERRRERLVGLAARLVAGLRSNREAHRHRVARDRERIAGLFARATRAIMTTLDRHAASTQRGGQVLTALSYQGVLARGFVLVRDAHGMPLRTAAAVQPRLRLDLEFADGHVAARAEAPRLRAPASARPRAIRRGSDLDQGSLFGR
jgi:exodeoxyribonuclease VII large subunit